MNGDYNCTLRPRVAVPVTGDAQCSDAPGKSSSPGTLRFLVFCEDQRYLKVRADMLQGFQFEGDVALLFYFILYIFFIVSI